MALTEKLTAIADAIRVQSGKSEKLTLDQMPAEIVDLQSLNFEVVGGTSAPSDPKENTIWVDTDEEITGWVISPNLPETAEAGTVWISDGTDSTANFNALRKQGIMIFPNSAKQYLDGAWISKTAQIYQNGEWVSWSRYLYKTGDLCADLTGGWQTRAWARYGNGEYGKAPSVSYGNSSVTISNTASDTNAYVGVWETKNDIDLTGVNTIRVHVLSASIGGSWPSCYLGVHRRTNSTSASPAAVVDIQASSVAASYDLDVSNLSGAYDVTITIGTSNKGTVTVKLDEIMML